MSLFFNWSLHYYYYCVSIYFLNLIYCIGYGGYSLINPEKVDFEKFPKIAEIPKWLYTHVKAGDCLYLPSQMWHVVHSHGDQNIAVALLFNQFHETKPEDVNYADCADKPNAIPLDQVGLSSFRILCYQFVSTFRLPLTPVIKHYHLVHPSLKPDTIILTPITFPPHNTLP